MPKCAPRPSQLCKYTLMIIASILVWVLLGILLNKLPFLLDHAHEWFQDNVFPGCALRKQPILHYTDNRQLRIFWEGRCADNESKLYYRIQSNGDFDVPENFKYNKLAQKRHLFSCIVNNVPSNVAFEYYISYCKQKTKTVRILTVPEATSKTPFKIALVGDSQLGVEQFRRHLKTIRRHRPDMFIHLGDMVQQAHKLRDWYRLLMSPLSILPAMPMVFVSGNHDWWGGRPNHYFHDRQKTFFSININGAKLIVLDSEKETAEQTAWLEQELQQGKPTFRIVLVHVPPFVEYWSPKHWRNGDNTWPLFVRKNWFPLLKKAQVDLILSGHQHNYQRGFKDGIHLVISGGGGSRLDTERVENHGIFKVTELKHHFVIMEIGNEQIQITALTDRNEVLDQFTLDKKVVKRYVDK